MKRALLLSFSIIAVLGSLRSGAALLPFSVTSPSSTDPYGADFHTTGLNVYYTYAGNNTGTFTISNSVAKGETYKSGSQSPGTHGQINGVNESGANPAASFNGYYTLTATVQQFGSDWQVTSGNFLVQGALLTGGLTTDLLLTGTLKQGAQTFGYDSSLKELEFLFNTGASSGPNGNTAILSDFFGIGTGAGGILLNYGTINSPPPNNAFSLTKSWYDNAAGGFADTFVPEPVFYPFAAAGAALMGLVFAPRKSA